MEVLKKKEYNAQNLAAVTAGFQKPREAYREHIRKYNIEPVVAINSFVSDTDRGGCFCHRKMSKV